MDCFEGAVAMIESQQQLHENFRVKAAEFLTAPSLLAGIDFDDAAVTLKRYALTELRDQELGSLLARFPKLIRQLDVATLSDLVTQVEARLGE
jgi:hypothetical protein